MKHIFRQSPGVGPGSGWLTTWGESCLPYYIMSWSWFRNLAWSETRTDFFECSLSWSDTGD